MPDVVAVIPVYNHPKTIGAMVGAVLSNGLKCIVVNDGSDEHCTNVLRCIRDEQSEQVTLVELSVNQGKGGAMQAGLTEALKQGFSHALQIDADGQHNTEDIPKFLEACIQYPDCVISGCPQFDDSVPRGRFYARYLTHVLVWINTLSLDIRDSMCGFRVYPLRPVVGLIQSSRIGRRMDFDVEILVRLHWKGLKVRSIPTRVRYPEDGVSHFKMWTDNALLTRMHIGLLVGMLFRSPLLLMRKVRKS
jgi:glycosyltransferase involved in cell wall biosynthesis